MREKRNQAFINERLWYIDWLLMMRGWFSRTDIMNKFKIQGAAASRDISRYKDIKDDNLFLNHSIKRYEVSRENFKPINEINGEDIFSRLTDFDESLFLGADGALVETIPSLTNVTMGIVGITQAILNNNVISISYCSMSSGNSIKKIAPHSMFYNDLKTYVRCYDLKRSKFLDLVVGRIDSIISDNGKALPFMVKSNDHEWNDFIELHLVVHPKVKHKEAIERDMQMVDGRKNVKVRKSLSQYWLRRWCVDCSSDASIKDGAYQLFLENNEVILNIGGFFPGVNNHLD